MSGLQMSLRAKVLRLAPKTHVVTLRVPNVGRTRSFRSDFALPGEALASVRQWGHGMGARPVGTVVAVRPQDNGTEVDVQIEVDSAWQRLADRKARVDVRCSFAGTSGIDPYGGRVDRVEID